MKKVKRQIDDEPNEEVKEKQEVQEPSEPYTSLTVFGFLTKDLNTVDIEQTYNILKNKIKVGKNRLDPDVLSEAIDEAPEWALKASQLHILAKEKLSRFEDVTFKLKYAEYADTASVELEELKRKGKISGQVSKEKIENWIILNIPEYQELLQEHRELKLAVDAFESLVKQFESKKSLLQTQGRILEKKKVIISGRGENE